MFLTLRNKDWYGGDVTVSDDGRFLVAAVRDVTPVQAYVIVDTITGQTTRGEWASLRDAQEAAELVRKGVIPQPPGKANSN